MALSPRKPGWLASTLFLVLAALMACNKSASPTAPAGAKSCSELGDSVKSANSGNANPVFKVISPNGGETFHLGDSIHIRVTESLNQSNANVSLKIPTAAGIKYVLIPPGAGGNVNVYANCDISFVLPDSLPSLYGTPNPVSLVSDSVKVVVGKYGDNTFDDLSDGFFRIQP